MAMPIEFPEANINLGKPEGWSDSECDSLPVWKGVATYSTEDVGGMVHRDIPTIVSCWKLNAEDLDEIQRSGVVWLSVSGNGMPPVSIFTENPFGAPQPDLG